MFELQIRNSKRKEFWIQLGKISWLVLFLYIVFVFGGLHPSQMEVSFLGMYCSFFIVIINIPSIWKIIVELIRHGNIELKIIVKTLFQILLPLLLINF